MTQVDNVSSQQKTYTIKEVAKLCGLPESTLRYYESIGLINNIKRDTSSKHRIYSEKDVNYIIAITHLSATGLSIEDMRAYLENRTFGAEGAHDQVQLLTAQKKQLEAEIQYMQLRIKYVEAKISYWNAVAADDPQAIKACTASTYVIADKMKLPQNINQGRKHAQKL